MKTAPQAITTVPSRKASGRVANQYCMIGVGEQQLRRRHDDGERPALPACRRSAQRERRHVQVTHVEEIEHLQHDERSPRWCRGLEVAAGSSAAKNMPRDAAAKSSDTTTTRQTKKLQGLVGAAAPA